MSTTFFLEGFWHPLVTPAHIVLLLGFGLLLGQQQAWRSLKTTVPLFLLTFTAGLFLARMNLPEWNSPVVLLVIALVSGILIAARWNLAATLLLVLSAVIGLVTGLDSTPLMIPGMGVAKVYSWMAGAVSGAMLLLVVTTVVASAIRHVLQGIPLRVLGSWVAASALMVLTLLVAVK